MIDARFFLERGAFTLDAKFSVPVTGITAVHGPSGCGKTTLLRAVAGLEHCPNAYLKVGDQVWQDAQRFLPTHKRPLGFVFQEASLFEHLRVQGNLEYGMRRMPAAERSVALDEAIGLLGIDPLLARRPDSLSGGERQRVAIARALLSGPRLLLMDEPLASLDREGRAEIMPYLERLRADLDIPVLYVSHSPDEVARLADHLLLMQDGRVRDSGPVNEMFTRTDLPLAHGADAEAIIEARVVSHDPDYHLTSLEFSAGTLSVVGQTLHLNQVVRVRLLARDVSLSLEPQPGTSILNIFPATVDALIPDGPAQVTVRLNAADVPILSRITRKSADVLALRPGKTVYAQVKSVAVLA